MRIFGRLFGKKDGGETPQPREPQQAVLVHRDGTHLPDCMYEECDWATIVDRLIEVIERNNLGESDGNETGPTETTLFMYVPVTCSPKSDPRVMRVSSALLGQEILDEEEAT